MKTISKPFLDSENSASPRPNNFTRTSSNLVEKYKRERRWLLIPLYHLLRLSDFAREGMENSGSYLFADHLYRNEPSGLGWLGKPLDRLLLNLPAARAMRLRCSHTQQAVQSCLDTLLSQHQRLRVLALPCGLPRDVKNLLTLNPDYAHRLDYTGMDLDPKVLRAAQELLHETPELVQNFHQGNALDLEDYPDPSFDLILSTGLGEFLNDDQLMAFYANVYQKLSSGGVFCTSTTAYDARSDFFLRSFELNTQYRSREKTAALLGQFAWRTLDLHGDPSGLQTFVKAVKA